MPKTYVAFLFCVVALEAQAQWTTSGSNIYWNGTGSAGIGLTSPAYKLDVNGPAGSPKARFGGTDGYITIGPQNASWAHIYTDRPAFFFNAGVWNTTGVFSSYNTADLTLQTNGVGRLTVSNSSGFVGIGTTTPAGKFTIQQAGNAWTDGLRIDRDASNYLSMTEDGIDIRLKNWGGGGIRLYTSLYEAFTILNNGNVGIMSTNPDSRLTVNGSIHSKEVKVDLTIPGPDYVFEKTYKLPSLDEVKLYIDENKHLPEVPSAAEMEKNGVQLGEMNMILLKKVEELTLYVIALKKQVNDLSAKK